MQDHGGQTIPLSDSAKPLNQVYVNLTCNFELVMKFILKSCNNKICSKFHVASKLLGLCKDPPHMYLSNMNHMLKLL